MQEHLFYLTGIEREIAISKRRKERRLWTVEVKNSFSIRYRIAAISPEQISYDLILSHTDCLDGLRVFSDNPKPRWIHHLSDGKLVEDQDLTLLPYAGTYKHVPVDLRPVECTEPNIKRWFVYLPDGWELFKVVSDALPYVSKLKFNNPETEPQLTISKK